MNSKKLLAAMLLACALFAQRVLALDEGKPAPRLTGKTIAGDGFDLPAGTGRVWIINFWATWCTPCREEMPAIDAYYKKYKTRGLEVVAISMDDAGDAVAVREVAKSFSFPIALKSEAQFKGLGRIWRMPSTFVIDRQGILRKNGSVGDPKVDLPLLESLVTPLLDRQ